MVITKSDIVIPTHGREVGKAFFVLEVEGEYAVLADGKARRVEKPKRKKIKHLTFAQRPDGRIAIKLRNGEKTTNSEIRKALAEYAAGKIEVQGGM